MTRRTDSLRALGRGAVLVLAAVVAVLPGCGGVDSGGTGAASPTLAFGPISGFGSIVVAGVHYDASQAAVVDADGRTLAPDALQLGATVRIDASPITTSGTRREAVASEVRVDEVVIGPVDAVDAATGRLTVLGQSVAVNAGTVFEASLGAGLAGLHAGQVLAVHGLLDSAAGRIVATRIEPRSAPARYVVRGSVASIDLAAQRMTVGTLPIGLANAGTLPQGLAAGRVVRVRLPPAATAGVWLATSVTADDSALPDREAVELEGRVTAFTSPTAFSVAGVPVDASAATVTGTVALGARVEVAGRTSAGTLVARRVEVDADDGAGDQAIELEGTISGTQADARTFVVRGVTVVWSDATRFESSTAADIRDGRAVSVKGRLAADRSRVEATLVHVER